MQLVEITDYPFNRVEIVWHGPFEWTKEMSSLQADKDLLNQPGLYRAETKGRERNAIKYIGKASEGLGRRLNGQHRIKRQLVDAGRRRVQMYLGLLALERRINLTSEQYKEIEYILQNVHWDDLISWHGLGKLPKSARGEGWHIKNSGCAGDLHREIAYPAFAVSGLAAA